MASPKPNVLFLMTDQQRFDAIAAMGNSAIHTPNLDRLARRGAMFTQGYSSCPVCIPARYTIRTGCSSPTTGIYMNGLPQPVAEQAPGMEERCGIYLPRRMAKLGYRTFGVGKFHSMPWDEDLGYEVHRHSEEMYGTPDQRARDAYAAYIAREHPSHDFLEGLMGERTEMYYMPQMSPLPAEAGVEAWAARETCALIEQEDPRPWFGFCSFIGPHPPCAPPLPFNRMYDPDRMPPPMRGQIDIDHMDEQIPWMNYLIWADDISDTTARTLKARYYGEITYIDQCIGRILDVVDARADGDNTLICFFSDHGDHLGDHHAWQKESFFEASCHVPYLVSWPSQIPAGQTRDDLVCLEDLFGIATTAAGEQDLREGHDVLGTVAGSTPPRDFLFGFHGYAGTRHFKMMVRHGPWKYIYMANGGREQLFHLGDDPGETQPRNADAPDTLAALRAKAEERLAMPNADQALEQGRLKAFPFEARPLTRIHQFDRSRGVTGFPAQPGDLLA